MYFQPLLNGFAMAGVLSVSSPRILRKTGRPDPAAGHRALAPLDRMTSGRADCAADVKSRVMFNPRFPGRRIAAASACAALFAVAAPAAVPTTSPDSPPPFAAPTALAKDADDEKVADAKKDRTTSEKATSEKKAPETESEAGDEKNGVAKPELPEPTTDVGRDIQARMDEATKTVTEAGGTIGMAFLDRETGEFICNDQCLDSFALASLSKVFIAEVVGYTNYDRPGRRGEIEAGEGDMPVEGNADAMLRDDMVRYSDNEATNALWSQYGGTKVIDSVKERYGLTDATIANSDWGSTMSSAADMVTFFDGLLAGEGGLSEVETRYLVQLMYSLPRYSYGNSDQNIGLRAALPDEFVGVKGGWVDPKIRTSAGFFGEDDRYVIAVLSRNVSPAEFTDAIAHVFPEGGAGVEERGDEAIRQAGSVNADLADGGSSATPWVLALLVATAAGFGLGWQMRRGDA